MELCGIYLNRGRVIALMAFIVMIPLLCFAEDFFKFAHMDTESSAYA
jgi:hypothetical protein